MTTSQITCNLPKPVSRFLEAVNRLDADDAIAAFTLDAVVNDIRREFIGPDAIRAWLDREIIGDHVHFEVLRARCHHGSTILTARTTGTFDKTNLPDPLDLTFYFTVDEQAITQLLVIANQPTPDWAVS